MADDAAAMAESPALAALAAAGIDHVVVRTRRARDVAEAAALRGVAIEALLKTIVVRRRENDYVFVLVPGDRTIDWAKLRAHLGERRISLPDAAEAYAATGYERGTITPFGASTSWPVILDTAATVHDAVSLGGGAHGVSVRLAARDLVDALAAEVVDVTKPAAA